MKIGAYLALSILGLLATSLGACTPGYIKASELNRMEQGPSFCDARCHELGMRMGALVLVSNELPGCVCQPLATPNASEAPAQGASAATAGEVVIAAAAAAEQQRQQREQQQQSSKH